jgi:RHS repeat-associated protein
MTEREVHYYHYDGQGNTIAMTDSRGRVANNYAYDEFGKLLVKEERVPNPFRFVGQYGVMDERNGLLYMRARYYDPEVGRFISKDPIGFAGGDVNLYGYVGSNPVNWVDPFGLDPIDYPILKCHVVTHDDPVENLYGAVILGSIATGLILGPTIPVIAKDLYYTTITTLLNPKTYQQTVDLVNSALIPGPPTAASRGGYIGGFVGFGTDWLTKLPQYQYFDRTKLPQNELPQDVCTCH